MRKKFNTRISISVIIAFILVGFLSSQLLTQFKKKKVVVSTSTIEQSIQNISELATSKLLYRGIVRYEEGQIKFITKKGFTMIYDASIKAGIDLKKVKVDINKRNINITLPQATILDININSDSLQFYDEEISIFNWQDKNDLVSALKYAKEDANSKIDKTTLKKQAMEQTKIIIKGFLEPLTILKNPYTIRINFLEQKNNSDSQATSEIIKETTT